MTTFWKSPHQCSTFTLTHVWDKDAPVAVHGRKRMQIVCSPLVVPFEVALDTTIDAKVVLLQVPRASVVVIIATTIGSVIRNNPVVVQFRVRGLRRDRDTVKHFGGIGLAIPRVKRPVVGTLTAAVVQHVVAKVMPAAKVVVEVHHGTRSVVEQVVAHCRLQLTAQHTQGQTMHMGSEGHFKISPHTVSVLGAFTIWVTCRSRPGV